MEFIVGSGLLSSSTRLIDPNAARFDNP